MSKGQYLSSAAQGMTRRTFTEIPLGSGGFFFRAKAPTPANGIPTFSDGLGNRFRVGFRESPNMVRFIAIDFGVGPFQICAGRNLAKG